MTYNLLTNFSGTRSITVADEHLETIRKYELFSQLIDSNGIINESVLNKLRLNLRSLIIAQVEGTKELLDLCIDVIYHKNMKAYGLQQLVNLYNEWLPEHQPQTEEE